MFPKLFKVCTFENFDGSFLMRWQGKTDKEPVMLMNHHDVVEATGEWTHAPFGGVIDSTGADDIYPEPKDKSGNPVKKTTVTIHENLLGKEITLEFSDGTEYTVIAEGTEISLYLSNNVTVENAEDLSTGYCEHMCHQDGIMSFFWKIVNFFNKLFKINSVCECGTAHY